MIVSLVCHPDTPPKGIDGVLVQLSRNTNEPDAMIVEFCVKSAATLLIPQRRSPKRVDGLWKTTCFEVFLRPDGAESYVEFNLSPSSEWAVYDFHSYRSGQRPATLEWDVEIETKGGKERDFFLYAELEVSRLARADTALALSAVIEEVDGAKSYWALAHAPGPPDFHNPACFTATLPPPFRP